MQCTKIILFGLNFLFWLCGVVMLVVAIWVLASPRLSDLSSVFDAIDTAALGLDEAMNDPLLQKAVYVIIGIGVFIMVVGFLGCCGVIKSSKCLLLLYTLMVGLTLLVEIATVILAVVFMVKVDEQIGINMSNLAKHEYYRNGTLDEAWNKIQREMECCGGLNYTDYRASYYYLTTGHLVPDTCCKMVNNELSEDDLRQCRDDASVGNVTSEAVVITESKHLHTKGCYNAMKDWFKSNATIVLAVVIGVIAIQVLGLVLGCCLRNKIDQESELV